MTLMKPIRLLVTAAYMLLAIGLIARVAPLADQDGRLLKQWPTEDGYLMLTIARNMSLGLGMSTAAGDIPTNGTQPLTTGVWALAFHSVDNDRIAGVSIILVIELILSLLTIPVLYGLARKLFERFQIDRSWALFCTGLWYASPIIAGHSMNCLESGAYVLLVVAIAYALVTKVHVADKGAVQMTWGTAALFAVLLSIAFYARNDAVFLIGAFCVVPLFVFSGVPRLTLESLPKVVAVGAATVIAASPWLFNNLTKFGHLMPISGIAQSAPSSFAEHAGLVPIVLFEYLTLVLPIPSSLDGYAPLHFGLAVALLALAAAAVFGFMRSPVAVRPTLAFIGLYSIAAVFYYGFVHGAPWFISRYIFPVSPFLAIAGVGMVAKLIESGRLPAPAKLPITASVCVLALALATALEFRIYTHGAKHMHDQVVEWVLNNVPENEWVGAVQTGTVGFFHDRTINLDGKVNPEALQALLLRKIPEYVVSKRVAVIADWYGIDTWMSLSPIKENYRLVVADEEHNLSVLARNDWATPADFRPADTFGF